MDKDIQILKARELEVVLKISQVVSRTLDLREILRMSCQMTAQALKADRCSIGLLYTKDVYEIIHTYRKKPSYPSIDGEKFKLADYTHIAQNLLRGKAFHLYDHKKIPLSILGYKPLPDHSQPDRNRHQKCYPDKGIKKRA